MKPRPAPPAAAATLLLLGAVAASGCGPEDLQLPATPDLDMLVQAYEMPTGTIDPQHIDQVLADARARIDAAHLEWLPDFLANFLIVLTRQLNDSGLSTDPAPQVAGDNPKIDAVVRVSRSCNGWDGSTASETTAPGTFPNGSLNATAVISDRQLRRTLTATGTACHAEVQPTNRIARSLLPSIDVLLDGTLNLYFYGPLPHTVEEMNVLVQISGEFGTSQMTVTGTFDFRVAYPNVDVRLPQPDGDLILSVGLNGVTLRGANATYSCDVALQTCGPV